MMFLWLLSKDKKNHIRYTTFYVCATYSHDKNITSTKLYTQLHLVSKKILPGQYFSIYCKYNTSVEIQNV